MKTGILLSAALLFALAACENKDKPAETAHPDAAPMASQAHSAAPAASSAAPVATAEAEAPLPNEHKADRKAFREISSTNYKAELDKLDKEIGAP